MTLADNSFAERRSSCSWRSLLILLAISFLVVHVVTRYGAAGHEVSSARVVNAIKCQVPQSQRQRLLGNGLHWISPVSDPTVFEPPRIAILAVSAVVRPINLDSESWLYNRPPPSC